MRKRKSGMKYDYEKFFEEKIKEIAREKEILDVGGGSPFQKRMAEYRGLLEKSRYRTLDAAPEYNPSIVGDIHEMPVESGSVNAVICLSVLEHVSDPQRAAEEIKRILKLGGKALIYTHFIYPYHARPPAYSDNFRFTEDGLRRLFGGFSRLEIKKHGGYFLALMFFFPFQNRLKFVLEPFCYLLDKIFKTERRTTTAGYYLYAIK